MWHILWNALNLFSDTTQMTTDWFVNIRHVWREGVRIWNMNDLKERLSTFLLSWMSLDLVFSNLEIFVDVDKCTWDNIEEMVSSRCWSISGWYYRNTWKIVLVKQYFIWWVYWLSPILLWFSISYRFLVTNTSFYGCS